MQINFSTSKALSDACTILNSNWVAYILIYLAYSIVSGAISHAGMPALPVNAIGGDPMLLYKSMLSSPAFLGASFASLVVSCLFLPGIVNICLKGIDGKKVDFNGLLMPMGTFINGAITAFLFVVITTIGTCLCILPGIFLGVRLCLALNYAVYCEMTPVEAIKASWNDTAGNFWHLLGADILLFLTSFAGWLLCCIGMFYTAPLASIAFCVIARTFSNANGHSAQQQSF